MGEIPFSARRGKLASCQSTRGSFVVLFRIVRRRRVSLCVSAAREPAKAEITASTPVKNRLGGARKTRYNPYSFPRGWLWLAKHATAPGVGPRPTPATRLLSSLSASDRL